jgi:hypothetical protein
MTADYSQTLSRHRRLVILQFLKDCAEYTCNASILQEVLIGRQLPSSSDQVITELVWLREQGFLHYTDSGDFIVVTGTSRGVDIARGLALHPGVLRPSPKV